MRKYGIGASDSTIDCGGLAKVKLFKVHPCGIPSHDWILPEVTRVMSKDLKLIERGYETKSEVE